MVVEAVQAKSDDGYRSPVLAADDAMKGVSSAILDLTIIFMAVFIPVAMMGAHRVPSILCLVSQWLSPLVYPAINAFTFSGVVRPAVAALHRCENGNPKDNLAARFRKASNARSTGFISRYVRGVLHFMHHRNMLWVLSRVNRSACGVHGAY